MTAALAASLKIVSGMFGANTPFNQGKSSAFIKGFNKGGNDLKFGDPSYTTHGSPFFYLPLP
jgi:hypothetical protein